MKNPTTISAEICLYGTRQHGFDYLARSGQGFTRGSQPDPTQLRYETITEAILLADRDLQAAGVAPGSAVTVYAPGGERFAIVRLDSMPMAGDLKWRPAVPAIVITPEEIARVCEGA